MIRRADITGLRFGTLIVTEMLTERKVVCRCDCGSVTTKLESNVKTGKTKSCGCERIRLAGLHSITHGDTGSDEHRIWSWMQSRCDNPKNPKYPSYGARGIKVDDRWRKYQNFLADMGRRPSSKHSIERKDNNGPYAAWNCKWATSKEQSRNTRRSHIVTAFGQTMTLVEWHEKTGINYGTIWSRIKDLGWTIEKALTVPGDNYHHGRHPHA